MYNFTIPMALMDFVPVIFFGITAVLLLRDLYNKMAKGIYALLAAGADVNAVNSAGLSALHWAVQKALNDHSKRIITLLLNAGGNLLQKDNYGRTPWDCASPEIKEWLRRR